MVSLELNPFTTLLNIDDKGFFFISPKPKFGLLNLLILN